MFEDFSKSSGIYCFENKINGMKYIGKSVNLRKRIKDHINQLRIGKDACTYLQNSWSIHGEENFSIYVIEECGVESISDMEIYYISYYNTKRPNGYNLTDGGDGTNGYNWTNEQRQSIVGSGNPFHNKKHTEETKKIMGDSQRGSKNHNFGKKFSDEIRMKLIENHPDFSGDNHPQFGTKRKNSSSIYRGVCFHKLSGKWSASLWGEYKKHIGLYEDEINAARAYDKYVIENDLPNPLNFPEDYE